LKHILDFKYALDVVLPRYCVVCGQDLLKNEQCICSSCLADLPKTHFEHQSHNPMADRLNEKLDGGKYSYATALFYYNGNYVEISKALKFYRNFRTGKYFAGMLAENIRLSEHLSDIDLVTCVPLHWTRKISRGYNQAEFIARIVAKSLNVDFANTLIRQKRTDRQAKIGGENENQNRLNNVKGAFKTRKDIQNIIKDKKHILIIDDVFTSGATLSECINAMITAKKEKICISAASIAYASC